MSDVTELLKNGELDRLLPLLYAELRRLAGQLMAGERKDHTLCATALVNEAYLKLLGAREVRYENRAQFFSRAAEAMRRLLVDHARKRGRQRRGGGAERITLGSSEPILIEDPAEILALDQALQRLEQQDPRMSQVVKLRFFAGLEIEETAAAMDISPSTVKREWTFARAWLFRALKGDD